MIDPQLAIGIISGGIGALVQFKRQAQMDTHTIMMQALKGGNDSANQAQSRGSGWMRGFALVIILAVGFGGLIYAASQGLKVSQIVSVDPVFKFLGLSIGGGEKVVEAEGFVIPRYVEDSIISIIFFLFGSSAAKR
jgi:type IV secretory pathway TrbF-like protein